ncbi:MAG TPA: hypothetical protein VJK48_04320 [Chlamydiales bacterium]|nr:hypothetical protein [Chlamydiales bacterium]
MKISIGQWLLVGVLACSCQSGKKKTYCQKEPAALEAFEEGVPNQKIAEEQRNENVEVSPSEPVAVSDEAPTQVSAVIESMVEEPAMPEWNFEEPVAIFIEEELKSIASAPSVDVRVIDEISLLIDEPILEIGIKSLELDSPSTP